MFYHIMYYYMYFDQYADSVIVVLVLDYNYQPEYF